MCGDLYSAYFGRFIKKYLLRQETLVFWVPQVLKEDIMRNTNIQTIRRRLFYTFVSYSIQYCQSIQNALPLLPAFSCFILSTACICFGGVSMERRLKGGAVLFLFVCLFWFFVIQNRSQFSLTFSGVFFLFSAGDDSCSSPPVSPVSPSAACDAGENPSYDADLRCDTVHRAQLITQLLSSP